MHLFLVVNLTFRREDNDTVKEEEILTSGLTILSKHLAGREGQHTGKSLRNMKMGKGGEFSIEMDFLWKDSAAQI